MNSLLHCGSQQRSRPVGDLERGVDREHDGQDYKGEQQDSAHAADIAAAQRKVADISISANA